MDLERVDQAVKVLGGVTLLLIGSGWVIEEFGVASFRVRKITVVKMMIKKERFARHVLPITILTKV